MEATETTRDDDSNRELWRAAANFSYLGIFFGVALAIGVFGGGWLDRRFHTSPWLTLAGMFVGIAAGFAELIRVARLLKRREEAAERNKKSKETPKP